MDRLKRLQSAVDTRDINAIIALAEKMPATDAKDAEQMLSRFYTHEVSVANALLEVIAFSKVYKSKIKPPLRGCFSLSTSEMKR